MKQLAVDLVILNQYPESYARDLRTALEGMVRASETRRPSGETDATRGAVFILRAKLVSEEAQSLLQSAARAVLFSRRGSLLEQLKRLEETDTAVTESQRRLAPKETHPPVARPDLEFFNGPGGFSRDGHEYVTAPGAGQWTPAPWMKVIVNPG